MILGTGGLSKEWRARVPADGLCRSGKTVLLRCSCFARGGLQDHLSGVAFVGLVLNCGGGGEGVQKHSLSLFLLLIFLTHTHTRYCS